MLKVVPVHDSQEAIRRHVRSGDCLPKKNLTRPIFPFVVNISPHLNSLCKGMSFVNRAPGIYLHRAYRHLLSVPKATN